MITQNSAEIELEIKERIKRAESACTMSEPKKQKQTATLAERQRILAIMAGMRRQFIREMENIKEPDKCQDVLLVLNAKVVAIDQAMNEIDQPE